MESADGEISVFLLGSRIPHLLRADGFVNGFDSELSIPGYSLSDPDRAQVKSTKESKCELVSYRVCVRNTSV